MPDNIVVGLDVGTTKVCVMIGQKLANSDIQIIGMAKVPSKGLKKGIVVDLGDTIKSIRKAVEEAENLTDIKISQVFVGIAGAHIQSHNASGIVAISSPTKEITSDDVNRVIEAARASVVSDDRQIIHVIPRDFIIDGNDGIKNPIGMVGTKLEVKVHVVTAALSSYKNLVKSVNEAGLEVVDTILQPLASAEAVLREDDKEIGVALVDIGGGTTDIAVFSRGAITFSKVLPVGGNNVTMDLAMLLKTPLGEAEKIKKKYGIAMVDLISDPNKEVEILGVDGEQLQKVRISDIAQIIQDRMEEIFRLVKDELEESGYIDKIPAGVVLTGGGSLLRGTVRLAEERLDQRVRIGRPVDVKMFEETDASPALATVVGLVKFGSRVIEYSNIDTSNSDFMEKVKQLLDKFIKSIKDLFE